MRVMTIDTLDGLRSGTRGLGAPLRVFDALLEADGRLNEALDRVQAAEPPKVSFTLREELLNAGDALQRRSACLIAIDSRRQDPTWTADFVRETCEYAGMSVDEQTQLEDQESWRLRTESTIGEMNDLVAQIDALLPKATSFGTAFAIAAIGSIALIGGAAVVVGLKRGRRRRR